MINSENYFVYMYFIKSILINNEITYFKNVLIPGFRLLQYYIQSVKRIFIVYDYFVKNEQKERNVKRKEKYRLKIIKEQRNY
ncbi:hypothetical protein H8356DRAFT_966653 [Neocallimastix lanati (nom. inval.)]|uniref:Uncharacterized protein n=1 Tax=Neocallimastix californiae TaxID=1754190 RepID=A0A1Y2FCK4_9FUNG|nr:hypothetical protein H8356DRAFT_966653 [Neocallimastix sp. JGI-2020a]ORY81643.1 hypothetical protein LY90DRAFT_3334 [Neocallimastix californiae]|eukprot:ORY81643.1 hypothetical protein LY90DRAFT_3334 [Neocallimastix californiae]